MNICIIDMVDLWQSYTIRAFITLFMPILWEVHLQFHNTNTTSKYKLVVVPLHKIFCSTLEQLVMVQNAQIILEQLSSSYPCNLKASHWENLILFLTNLYNLLSCYMSVIMFRWSTKVYFSHHDMCLANQVDLSDFKHYHSLSPYICLRETVISLFDISNYR